MAYENGNARLIRGIPISNTLPVNGQAIVYSSATGEYIPTSAASSQIIWTGAWSAVTAYNQYDAVEYNGSSYIANTGNTNKTPGVDPEWDLWIAAGSAGAGGEIIGQYATFTYDSTSTTDSDPGNYKVKMNSLNMNSVTEIYINSLDSNNNLIVDWANTWDDSSSSIKGVLTFFQPANNGSVSFNVSSVSFPTGYIKVVVTFNSVQEVPNNGDVLYLTFSRNGDKGDTGATGSQGLVWQGAWLTATAYALQDAVEEAGSSYICIEAHTSGTFATDLAAGKWELLAQKGADGAGTGDVVGPASATDNAIARFDTTTGKLIQNSSATLSDAGLLSTDSVTLTTRLNAPEIKATGAGGLDIHNNAGTQVALFGAGGSTGTSLVGTTNIGSASADYHQVAGGTGTITDTAAGSSTNININLVPKGTGVLQSSGVEVATISGTQTLTNKTINGSNNTITNVSISTGVSGLGTGVATFLATPTSANLLSALTTKTGTNNAVFSTAPTFDTNITVGTTASATGSILFKGLTSGTVTLSTADAAGTWTMKLPTTAGTSGYFLQTDGSGNTTWAAASGGGLSWNATVNGATGTGLALAMDNSYAASGIGQSITIGNTQTNALQGLVINTGTSDVQHHQCINLVAQNSDGIVINYYGSTTQAIRNTFGIIMNVRNGGSTSDFNTNSNFSYTSLSIVNRANAGAGINTGIVIRNGATDFSTSNAENNTDVGVGSGLHIFQSGANGTGFSVNGGSNVNASTNGIIRFALSSTQSGATVMQKIDLGTSAQGHTGLYVLANNASSSLKGISVDLSTAGTGYAIYATSSLVTLGRSMLTLDKQGSQTASLNLADLSFASNSSPTTTALVSCAKYVNGTSSNQFTSWLGAAWGATNTQFVDVATITSANIALQLPSISGLSNSAKHAALFINTINDGSSLEGTGYHIYQSSNVVNNFNANGRTTPVNFFQSLKNNNAGGGSVTDNFNFSYFKRSNIVSVAGGTLVAQGSVIKAEGVSTQTAGTLTDTMDIYNATQSSSNTTGKLFTGVVGSTERFKVHPMVANSGTNTAYIFDTTTSLSGTTNLATFGNAGTTKVTIDNTGGLTLAGRLNQPMGEASYFSTTGSSVTISAQSDGSTNMVVVNPTTTFTNDKDFDNGGGNTGRIRYTGATTRMFHVAVTISGSPATNNDEFVFGVAKNGAVDADCKILQKFGTTSDTQSTALHCMVSLATNDYIELYVGNMTAGRNVTIKTLNIFAMGM